MNHDDNSALYVFFALIGVITIAGMFAGVYSEHKRTARYETCIKYHSPKECK